MFSTVGIPANLSVPCHTLNESGSVTGHLKSPLSFADGWQHSVSVPKLVCGTKVPQTSGRMLCNSVNRRDNTKSGNCLNDSVEIRKTDMRNVTAAVNTSTPFNRRVTAVTAQSVHGNSALSGLNLSDTPQQIKKNELSNNESFKFRPQMAHASGRRNVLLDSLHQSEEGNISGIKGFRFLPQAALPLMSDRTDVVAPKYEGGFTSRVLHYGSVASASQASNPSQVSAVPSTSFDVLDRNRTSKPTETVAKPLQQTPTPGGSAVNCVTGMYSSNETVPRPIECLTQVESSALEVLEGLDTSSLFDDF
jgi:hypothetical protein